MEKPILFLDVDGPLNPYAAKPTRRPEGYDTHRITPPGWAEAIRVWLNPEHGPMLLTFAEKTGAELVWATTWEDGANEHIGPRIGLPELPVVHFGTSLGRHDWKWLAVADYAAGRPLAWLDDDFAHFQWPATQTTFKEARGDLPTMLYTINPGIGMRKEDLDAIEQWMKRSTHE